METTKNFFDAHTQWYELWVKQTKIFHTLAEKHLKSVFDKDGFLHPESHQREVKDWLTLLKKQWHWIEVEEQTEAYENQVKLIGKLCLDATEHFMTEWLSRTEDKKPIHSIRELYELWLQCCHEVYAKAMRTKAYQQAYGDMMNAAIHYWKSTLPK